jgi:ankyrin repeat protein
MNGNTIQKPISPKSKRRKIIFPKEGIFQMDKKTDSKELFDKIENELKEKENYKPELSIYERNELNKQFIEASKQGDLEKVKEFLSKGADVNAQDDKGWTGLRLAFWYRKRECALFLLQYPEIKLDMEILTKEFTKASDRGDLKLVKELLPKVDVNAISHEGRNGLILASRHNCLDCVSVILNNPRTDVNIKDSVGCTALMYASGYGNKEVVSLLLQHPKIDVNIKRDYGLTALIEAVYKEHYDIISLLIDAGAEVPFNYLHKIGFKNIYKYIKRKFQRAFA